MDAGNIQVQNASLVLYVNGEYRGVYSFADKIDGNLFQLHGYPDDGDLFMAVSHMANFAAWAYDEPNPQNEGDDKQDLADGWEKKEGLPLQGEPGAFDSINELTQFISGAPPAVTSEPFSRARRET